MKLINDIITSRNNQTVKWAASLQEKKWREREKCFIAEGEKLTYEAIEAKLPLHSVFVAEGKKDRVLPRLAELLVTEENVNTPVYVLSDTTFEKISTEKAPQGVISVIKYLDFFYNIDIIYKEEFFLEKDEKALALCSVRDPGNLGSVIRSAVAFGVDHIVLTSDCADVYNPKTVRSAMGSLFRTKITMVKDFESFIASAKENGRRVFAAELTDNARPLNEIGMCGSDIIIIGNEGHGIPEDISAKTSGSVYIPISKKTESLNASVAAAIFMWEQNK
jgi:TrmH family RNA methyltransferase